MTLAHYDFLGFMADTGFVYEESRRKVYDCGNTCSLWYIKDKKIHSSKISTGIGDWKVIPYTDRLIEGITTTNPHIYAFFSNNYEVALFLYRDCLI